jgi:protein-disulfide isomerase
LALEVIRSVQREGSEIRLKLVDVSRQPEVAVRYGVMGTPAIVIDQKLAFRGVPKVDALRRRLLAADEG